MFHYKPNEGVEKLRVGSDGHGVLKETGEAIASPTTTKACTKASEGPPAEYETPM